MKKSSLLFAFIYIAQIGFCQVPKKVVVEHFTNTKCSICASRNPGFYTNYTAQTDVIHLAVHPSAPYSGCVLSQHNVLENDARTNYYGVYGGTPVLVIQGVPVSTSVNYGSSSIFTPHLGQMSPASITIRQTKYGNDSIRSRVVIKTEAMHSLAGLSLFVVLAEDTLNYTGSNGEPVHFDVFRKSLTGATGLNISLPASVGDSVVYSMSSTVNAAWNFSRIFTLAILQETATKAVVQAQSISAGTNNTTTGISNLYLSNTTIKAYVTDAGILVKQDKILENGSMTLYDITGRVLLSKVLDSNSEIIPLPEISAGIYLYALKSGNSIVKTGKLIIQ
ncbi:hypothetical protein CNR22_01880 [Sphingobacteriaceae bacterium]|nr:hypothetical protein CNR22_01880 [Sphingobacteriaceae bacterium]